MDSRRYYVEGSGGFPENAATHFDEIVAFSWNAPEPTL